MQDGVEEKWFSCIWLG